ncbi:MAG: DNA-directed RNA polymerase subunit K [Candidatus Aenigmarchaeota archaeon]|nr:DNA-directed RNA polymerase subunit K [Candidatus Aenigmarchaeota archaeon]
MEKYSRFEKARIICARALQLSMGAPSLLKKAPGNPIEAAKEEYATDVIPITVVRH